jgi:hypothetical protein
MDVRNPSVASPASRDRGLTLMLPPHQDSRPVSAKNTLVEERKKNRVTAEKEEKKLVK